MNMVYGEIPEEYSARLRKRDIIIITIGLHT